MTAPRPLPPCPVGTHVSGPLNSTRFTNCCGLAVIWDGEDCPGCKRPVTGLPRQESWRRLVGGER